MVQTPSFKCLKSTMIDIQYVIFIFMIWLNTFQSGTSVNLLAADLISWVHSNQ